MKIVKYQNRKFYELRHGHITLSEIWEHYKAGLDVSVIDHKTKLDITAGVLADAAYHTLPAFKRAALLELALE